MNVKNLKSVLGGKKWGGTMLVGIVAILNSVNDMGVSETTMIAVIHLMMVFVFAEALIDAAHAFGGQREKIKRNGHGAPPPPDGTSSDGGTANK